MSEERAPYTTDSTEPFNGPAQPGVAAEYRRARADFTKQVDRRTAAEELAARLETRLQEIRQAAFEVCRQADNLKHIAVHGVEEGPKILTGTNKEMTDYTAAIRQLASLISYPGWHQL